MSIFFKGILFGFAIAAPVGPIGILCIRKTLRSGRLSGLFSGLGAAVADLLYAITAAFGFTLIPDFFSKGHLGLQLIGGAFLIYLGSKTFVSPGLQSNQEAPASTSPISDFLSTFLLTLTNPLTILAFFALFASFGLSGIVEEKKPNIALLFFGIFLGSCSWWLLLSEGISFFRKKMGNHVLHWVNRAAGVALVLFGILSWVSIAFKLF